MMERRVILPHPWGVVQFFELNEPVRETDTERFFRKRLYIADWRFEGGKLLLRESVETVQPKFVVSGP